MKQQTGACKVELCRLRPKDDGRAALRARGFPHDRNARVRIETYVLAWNAKQKQEGQAPRPDNRRLPARAACAAMALHQLPDRPLLPVL
jgi:hypothetical protein